MGQKRKNKKFNLVQQILLVCISAVVFVACLIWANMKLSPIAREYEGNKQTVSSNIEFDNITDANLEEQSLLRILACYYNCGQAEVENAIDTLPEDERNSLYAAQTLDAAVQTLNTYNLDLVQGDTDENVLSDKSEKNRVLERIYSLNERYTTALNKVLEETKEKVLAIPSEERTYEKLSKIVEEAIAQGNTMEQNCDTEMMDLIKELEKYYAGDVDKKAYSSAIYEAYTQEKRAKKTEIMELYGF